MNSQLIIKKTGRLLFGTPLLLVALIISGGILGLLNIKHPSIGYAFGIVLCGIIGLIYPHYALGRAAKLLGESWVYYGVLPILLIPIGTLISWVSLIDKRSKLKNSL